MGRDRLGYIPALDGLRGVAILLVLCSHYLGILGGSLGVDVFFVLSGFLITTLLLEELDEHGRVSLTGFYVRRARRLLPALACFLAVYLVAAVVQGRAQVLAVLLGGFYTGNIAQAFWHPAALTSSGIAHLWSLAEEEQFYLLWPVALALVARRTRPAAWIAGAIVVLVAYRIALAAHGASHVRLYLGPDTHADGLLAGALLAVLRRRGLELGERCGLAGFTLLIVGFFLRSILIHREAVAWDAYGLSVFEFAAVLTVGAAVSKTSLADALRSRLLVWLGQISYSLYLWHYAVLWLMGRAVLNSLPASVPAARVSLTALTVSVIAAWLSYRFIEQPFRRRRIGKAIGTRLEKSAGGELEVAAVLE